MLFWNQVNGGPLHPQNYLGPTKAPLLEHRWHFVPGATWLTTTTAPMNTSQKSNELQPIDCPTESNLPRSMVSVRCEMPMWDSKQKVRQKVGASSRHKSFSSLHLTKQFLTKPSISLASPLLPLNPDAALAQPFT